MHFKNKPLQKSVYSIKNKQNLYIYIYILMDIQHKFKKRQTKKKIFNIVDGKISQINKQKNMNNATEKWGKDVNM